MWLSNLARQAAAKGSLAIVAATCVFSAGGCTRPIHGGIERPLTSVESSDIVCEAGVEPAVCVSTFGVEPQWLAVFGGNDTVTVYRLGQDISQFSSVKITNCVECEDRVVCKVDYLYGDRIPINDRPTAVIRFTIKGITPDCRKMTFSINRKRWNRTMQTYESGTNEEWSLDIATRDTYLLRK